MDFVGWKTRGVAQRYVGLQPSATGALERAGPQSGAPLDVEARYAAAIELPLQHGFKDKFAAFK